MLGLFAYESDGALRTRFAAVYKALVILVWANAALGISLVYHSIHCELNKTFPSLPVRRRDLFTSAAHTILLGSASVGSRHRLQPMSIPLSDLACLRIPVRR